MKRKSTTILIASLSLVSSALLALGGAHFLKNGFFAKADTSSYVLDMTRSVASSELSSGEVTYNTTNGNPISFRFNSSKAEVNNSGILNFLTEGYFYNDTAITGIENVYAIMSGGSATLTYGNDKSNLNFGSETFDTSGNDDVVFNYNLDTPSDYFKLDFSSGPSLLKRLKITYSCTSSSAKTPVTILFQGDSITDNTRSRTNLNDLGGGYASMVAKELESTYGTTHDFTFINRAHSGWNLIDDWNAGGVNHYEEEFYQYNPDIATILIGYNDIMDGSSSGGVSDADFEACYRELLQGLTSRGIKAVCLSAFFINENGNDYVRTEFPAKRQIVHDLAEEFNAEYIDMKPYMLQAVEDGAYKMELFGDLTHPWAAGCRIIADLVVDKISGLIDNSYVSPLDLGTYTPLVPSSDNAEDYTGKRAFLSCSMGKLEYDNVNFYSRGDFASTKSVKMTNDLLSPEQPNAYVKAMFDFSDETKKDLTSGTLKIDIKTENMLPTLSFKAHSGLETSSRAADMSTAYSLSLSDTSKAVPLENGWKEVTINLDAWALEQTNTALANAVALEIIASKGESDSSRATYGVDGTLDSIIWMDNLRFELNSGPVDYHAAKESFSSGNNFTKVIEQRAYNKAYFEYQITSSSGSISIAILNNDWANGFGYFNFSSTGPATTYNGVECSDLTDGWKAVTIVFNSSIKVFGERPEQVGIFFLHGPNTTASGYLDHIEFSKDNHPDKDAFNSGTNKTISVTSDAYTSLSFNYTITTESSTYFQMVILNAWSNGYGYFKFNKDGASQTYTGVTTTALGDGWISVTIDFTTTTQIWSSKPANVDMMLIRGDWTTANGYVENVTFHK